MIVEVENRDPRPYELAWAEGTDRNAWQVVPVAVRRVELESAAGGTLLLTQSCDFNGTWELGAGLYALVIDGGVATLRPVTGVRLEPLLREIAPCAHEGP